MDVRPSLRPHRCALAAHWWSLALLLLAGCSQTVADGPLPDDAPPATRRLTGTDLEGTVRTLSLSAGCRGVVVVFLSTECPISNGSLPSLNDLSRAWSSRGIEFYGVVAARGVSRAAALAHTHEYGIPFPVLLDPDRRLARQLEPTHTPQAFVLNSAGEVVYSGRIDDRYAALGRKSRAAGRNYVGEALRSLIAGRPVAVARTEPIGCVVEEAGPSEGIDEVTYARDIAPLLNAHCVTCHRPGEIGPFALTNFAEASRHARQIKLVTEQGLMPPWRPTPDIGHFRDERRLSEEELSLLARWAELGAPEGDPGHLPPAREFTPGWQLGEPDLVLEMAESFDVPAAGPDLYRYFIIPSRMLADRLVAAVEFRPGNPRVVHHASFAYDTRGEARRLDALHPGPGYQRFGDWGFTPTGTLGGWAAGVTPRRLPEGSGRLLERGADVVLQVHYHPTGKLERDRSRLGLFFAPETARQVVIEIPVANLNLAIPAGAARHRHFASYTLPVATTVLAVAPHMHFLGRELRSRAVLPDGRVEPLIEIADWDFNWQDAYYYAEPMRFPAGTMLQVEILYDNSSANPQNPHSPPQWVRWGQESTAEMGLCFFDVTTDTTEELALLRQHSKQYVDAQQP